MGLLGRLTSSKTLRQKIQNSRVFLISSQFKVGQAGERRVVNFVVVANLPETQNAKTALKNDMKTC